VNTCTQYALTNVPDCTANFQDQGDATAASAASAASAAQAKPNPKPPAATVQPVSAKAPSDDATGPLLDYLMGS